ncbi:hypothetical protein HYH02_002391 [Chlamydomonas schloesseri]|uniref:Methyltransferase domain-containing protein n=1 Tax=Chlamydomonas schloesseri TaxID=2026947 RepID=A0A835WRZ3_9CHLO|nr:hypothetical protein HYH02_002391 [Chlamydomonas schloesseri]|eukprot:KAG2453058.1 hypothetical protein HYH02_002391 [Chlamydomonas schloesseri]
MLAHASLRRGQRVLDLATGAGLFAVAAGRVVGSAPGGVLALDLSPGMVELARRNVKTSGLRNIEVRQADAESTDLPPASYDLIAASAALPYMHRPGAALARWRRWLRPNGRLVANSFKSPYDPECGLLYELAAAHGLGGVLADPLAAVGGDAEGVRRLLEAAGYKRVQVTEESMEVLAPAASAREYAEAMWASSLSSPHHCLEQLLAAAQPQPQPPQPPQPQQPQQPDGSSSSSGSSASTQVSFAAPSVASSAAGHGIGLSPAGQRDRGGAGAGGGGVSAAAMAAAAAASASAIASTGAGASRAGRLGGGRIQAKPLGGGAAALGPKLQPAGRPATQLGLESAAASAAAASAAAAAIDPVALQRLKDEFLLGAERSVKKRLRSGAVRTTVHVLWAVAYAS